MTTNKITTVIADDHLMFSQALQDTFEKEPDIEVLWTAPNGQLLLDRLKNSSHVIPNIILLDINMPIMNGIDTLISLKSNFPSIKVLILTMEEKEELLCRLLSLGANGIIIKSNPAHLLIEAIRILHAKGCYLNDKTNELLMYMAQNKSLSKKLHHDLNDREREFLIHCSSELTYKEIASLLKVSLRTIDWYRDTLFTKLDVKNRVGLVLFAIKEGIVKL